jgi:hypothetical protein
MLGAAARGAPAGGGLAGFGASAMSNAVARGEHE